MKSRWYPFVIVIAIVAIPEILFTTYKKSLVPLPTIRVATTQTKAPTFLVAEPLEIRGKPVSHVEPSAADVICEVDAVNPAELDTLDYSATP